MGDVREPDEATACDDEVEGDGCEGARQLAWEHELHAEACCEETCLFDDVVARGANEETSGGVEGCVGGG